MLARQVLDVDGGCMDREGVDKDRREFVFTAVACF